MARVVYSLHGRRLQEVSWLLQDTTKLSTSMIAMAIFASRCICQGDACMKAAIREVLEVEGSAETGPTSDVLRLLVANLASTLVATPDPPDASPPLYLLRGLTNALRSSSWQKDTDIQAVMSISLLHALSAASQDSLPYHIHSVEGNDSLYGGDSQVQQEAEQLCTTILHNILSYIQSLTGIHEKRCGALALTLFWCIVTWCDLTQPQMMKVASQTWSLVLKHNHPETVVQAKDWISRRSVQYKDGSLAQLVRQCQA